MPLEKLSHWYHMKYSFLYTTLTFILYWSMGWYFRVALRSVETFLKYRRGQLELSLINVDMNPVDFYLNN